MKKCFLKNENSIMLFGQPTKFTGELRGCVFMPFTQTQKVKFRKLKILSFVYTYIYYINKQTKNLELHRSYLGWRGHVRGEAEAGILLTLNALLFPSNNSSI